jgi:hypothetical protein
MSKFAFYILCFFSSSLYAQQATLKLKFIAAKENTVTLQLPLDGTTFYPSRISKAFCKDSSLTVAIFGPIKIYSKI